MENYTFKIHGLREKFTQIHGFAVCHGKGASILNTLKNGCKYMLLQLKGYI